MADPIRTKKIYTAQLSTWHEKIKKKFFFLSFLYSFYNFKTSEVIWHILYFRYYFKTHKKYIPRGDNVGDNKVHYDDNHFISFNNI